MKGRPSRSATRRPTVDFPLPGMPTRTIPDPASGIDAGSQLVAQGISHHVDGSLASGPEPEAERSLAQEDSGPAVRGSPGGTRVAYEARRAGPVDEVQDTQVRPQQVRRHRALVRSEEHTY